MAGSSRLSGLCTKLLASVLLGGSIAFVGGCDVDTPDKRIDSDIAQALPKLESGSPADLSAAQALLGKAAGESTASLPQRVRAKVLQGQCQLQMAAALQPQIDDNATQINRLAWDIRSLAAEIQSHNQLAAMLTMYNPAQLQENLKKEVDEAQGSASQKDWVKTGAGSVPTLAAVAADISNLETQAKALQSKMKSLTDQRNKLQSSADALTQQSELAKGNQAVDLFKQAADNRKQADDLSLQADVNSNLLSRVQADLAIKQGQQTILNQAITDFGNQSDNSGSSWGEIQKQIGMQRDQAKALLGADSTSAPEDDPTGGTTIASKAAAIGQLAQKNQTARSEALSDLNSAVGNFREAVSMAQQLQQEVQTRTGTLSSDKPEAVAAKALLVTVNQARYRMQQAEAQVRLAALSAGQAVEAETRLELAGLLKPILDQAKLSIPQALTDSDNKIADAMQNGRKDADSAFQEADKLLGQVVEGAVIPPDVQKAGHAAKIFAQYRWYLLASSVGDAAATAHLQAAQAERDTVIQNGGTIQNLPAELAVAPTTAPVAPAPTEAPAAPPSPVEAPSAQPPPQ